MNEKGTEATAATAVIMVSVTAAPHVLPLPPPIFRADHPFIFMIRHNPTGEILFIGKVGDPSQ